MKRQHLALVLLLGLVLVAYTQTVTAQTTATATPTPSPTPEPTIDEAAKIFSMNIEIVLAVAILAATALLVYFGLRKEN